MLVSLGLGSLPLWGLSSLDWWFEFAGEALFNGGPGGFLKGVPKHLPFPLFKVSKVPRSPLPSKVPAQEGWLCAYRRGEEATQKGS